MKKNLFYLFALICSMSLFTACSEENETWEKIPQTDISVSSGNATLQINGETSKTGSVQMTVKSETKAALAMKDVIPGYSDLNVDVELEKQADDSFKFAGTTQVNTAPTTRLASSEPAILTVEVDGTITLDGKVTLKVTASGAGLFVGTYKDAQLALKYSESDLTGKTVFYTIEKSVPVLTLVNVIPGEQATAIPTVYLDKDGAFSGKFTTVTGAALTYSGSITAASGMALNIEATLSKDAQGGLAKTWPLSHELMDESTYEMSEFSTVRIVWEVDETTTFPADYFGVLVPSLASAPLAEVLKDITLTADGNLVASYYDKIIPSYFDEYEQKWIECEPMDFMGMQLPPEGAWLITVGISGLPINPYDRVWKSSPKNLLHWYAKDNHIHLIPNIAQILKQMSDDQSISQETLEAINSVMNILPSLSAMDDATLQALAQTAISQMLPGVDMSALDAKLIRQVLGWLTDGIPLKYKAEGDSLYLYVDKDMIEPFMKVLIPLLPTLDAMLGGLMPEGLPLSAILGMFFQIESLTEIGNVWNESTTGFEMGINFLTTKK